ncbi:MAG: hypothetical protein AB8G22_08025 [Saprospiraceae bacterium]
MANKGFKNSYFKRWFIQGTIGVLLTGAGICMIGEAGFFKHSDPPFWEWVVVGTGALIVFMGGLTVFVGSLKYRIFYELETNQEVRKRILKK